MIDPPTSGHLDLDALADVLAGEREDDRHLRDCAACGDRLAELAAAEVAVAASLATLPPPALPEGLSQRLAEALRAEALQAEALQAEAVQAQPARTPVRRGATVTTLRRWRPDSWVPSVAASLVLVLAGGLGYLAVQGSVGSDDAATSDTAAGGGSESTADEEAADALAAPVRRSGVDYADAAQRAAVLPSLLAGARAQPFGSVAPEVPAAPASPALPAASELPAPALGGAPLLDPALARLRDPVALEECLSALRSGGSPAAAPLALDYAAYEGSPALAVVQPDTDPGRVVLTVVGPGCSASDADTLLRTRLARP